MDNEDAVVHIKTFNKKGWGVGSSSAVPGAVIEVIGALPSEEVLVELGRKRRRCCKGLLKQVIVPSSSRVTARCIHVPQCGGCVWQQIDYDQQVKLKQVKLASIVGALCSEGVMQPIIPCDSPWAYRNKMEFSFSENKAGEKFLGLIIAGSRGHVLNLEECHLVSPWFIDVLKRVRNWWNESDLKAYRLDDSGALRTLILREGKRTGDKLIMLTVSGNPTYALKERDIKEFLSAVASDVRTERVSVYLRIQQAIRGSPTQFFEIHLCGPDHLLETCRVNEEEFTFKISPSSFFQPNTAQAEKLYAAARNMIEGKKKHILDLYAGIATLGIVCASRAEKVTSIELNPYAVFDGESNIETNGISNVHIVCGDVGKILAALKLRDDWVAPDLVIVDPPRTGLDPAALEVLKEIASQEILYISCNPVTQVANIHELALAGYSLKKLQPVDQFPHTIHLETIALLQRT